MRRAWAVAAGVGTAVLMACGGDPARGRARGADIPQLETSFGELREAHTLPEVVDRTS